MSNQEATVVEQLPDGEVGNPPMPAEAVTGDEAAANPAAAPPADTVKTPAEPTENLPANEPLSIHTLQVGQRLTGKVKNIADFGAFVDIGLPQDGLIHISELAKQKVEKVTDVVSQGQEVEVWVKKVDSKRGRISLTLIKPITLKFKDIAEETELEGTVTRLEPYGAFVDIGADRDGLVHISQITHDYIKHPQDALTVGQKVNVKVLKVNRKKRQVDLSIKALLAPPPPPEEVKKAEIVKPVEPIKEKEEGYLEEEAMPTAMAIAYAASQGELLSSKSGKDLSSSKGKSKRKRDIDDIVARTLAGRN